MGISKDNFIGYNNRYNSDEEDKKPVFGQPILCCKKRCEAPIHATHMNKPYCYAHYPVKQKVKIRKYSGRSNRPWGAYDQE